MRKYIKQTLERWVNVQNEFRYKQFFFFLHVCVRWQVCWQACGSFRVSCRRRRTLTLRRRRHCVPRSTWYLEPIWLTAFSSVWERWAWHFYMRINSSCSCTATVWCIADWLFAGGSHLLPHPPDVRGSQFAFEGSSHTNTDWKCTVAHQICSAGSCCVHRSEKGFYFVYRVCVCMCVKPCCVSKVSGYLQHQEWTWLSHRKHAFAAAAVWCIDTVYYPVSDCRISVISSFPWCRTAIWSSV